VTSAHQALCRRVRSWAARLHLTPKAVRFRSMPKKWGTCSVGGTITLASDLVDQEPRFQDFVIVHELVHLLVARHGKIFDSVMSEHLPGWQDMEALRQRKHESRAAKRSRPHRHAPKRSRTCGRRAALRRVRALRRRLRRRR
jgi:predicted metal-dependent hydrolase